MVETSLPRLALLLAAVYGLYGSPLEPVWPFRLLYTPAHIVRHVTRDVTLRCENDAYIVSRLREVSRIRVLKKSATGWDLVAELRDNEDEPSTRMNATVSAHIGQDVRDTFLEISWDLASEDTYGTYMCDIIGFDKFTYSSLTELTSEVTVFEENVTASDLLDVLKELKEELSSIEDKTKKHVESLGDGVEDISKAHDDQTAEIASIKKEIDAMHREMESAVGNISFLSGNIDTFSDQSNVVKQTVKNIGTEVGRLKHKVNFMDGYLSLINETAESMVEEVYDMKGNIASFNGEVNALENNVDLVDKHMHSLEKKVEKLSGEMAYLLSLTRTDGSKPQQDSPFGTFGDVTRNDTDDVSWPGGWFSLLVHKQGCPYDRLFTGISDTHLKLHKNKTAKVFCETSGGHNSRAWPHGSYCVNRMFGLPCPNGLSVGRIDLSSTDVDYVIMPGLTYPYFDFCCQTSGSIHVPMVLPTDHNFILYRRGGECQQIKGMKSTTTGLSLDTVNVQRSNIVSGYSPDTFIHPGLKMFLYLCEYEKE